nr:MAG TPA: hypothetical protein [Caudoviricetes sp.]
MSYHRLPPALLNDKITHDIAELRERLSIILPERLRFLAASKNCSNVRLAKMMDISLKTMNHYVYRNSQFKISRIENFVKINEFLKDASIEPIYKDFSSYELALMNLLTYEEKQEMIEEIIGLMHLTDYDEFKISEETGICPGVLRKMIYNMIGNNTPIIHSYTLYYLLHYLREKPFCNYITDIITNNRRNSIYCK